MNTVGAYEAKTHLSRLLDRVARGETITITKHGVPVAVLTPPKKMRKTDPKDIIAELKKFRKKIHPDGLTIREMIEEGRR